MFNRSNICKIANDLRKKGYTLSQAFRMAWKLAKSKAAVKVAGVSKYDRQTALEHLRRYAADDVKVTLVRESKNAYDSNAIAVLVSVNDSKQYKIGYIPAAVAALLSKVIDNITEIKVSVQAITGGFYADMMSGLMLNLSI
ncbi:MAG: HIRAN domain-containing protein [Clostridia bacterium]|nr:HIRAN domain-containing protein [Clostridia bacterium]